MANKKTKKDKTKSQELYFFYSVGCAFCKKLEPLVDDLIAEGNNILKLDTSDDDNRGLKKEIEEKYDKQCGTPWLVNPENGNQVCGFKERDILDKWIAGEDIPIPPRPKTRAPKVPFHGASDEEVNKWKEEYNTWKDDNSHVPTLLPVEDVLKHPRPKSDPPPPPLGNFETTQTQIDEWKKEYTKWYDENRHIPTLQPPDILVQRIQQQASINKEGLNQPAPREPLSDNPQTDDATRVSKYAIGDRMDHIEAKLNKLMNHLGVK